MKNSKENNVLKIVNNILQKFIFKIFNVSKNAQEIMLNNNKIYTVAMTVCFIILKMKIYALINVLIHINMKWWIKEENVLKNVYLEKRYYSNKKIHVQKNVIHIGIIITNKLYYVHKNQVVNKQLIKMVRNYLN